MEIHAVGDRIRVTVNGRVILDGDIREACQGHNVAPDGSKKNPYTIDIETIRAFSTRKDISDCSATAQASSSATCACWI